MELILKWKETPATLPVALLSNSIAESLLHKARRLCFLGLVTLKLHDPPTREGRVTDPETGAQSC